YLLLKAITEEAGKAIAVAQEITFPTLETQPEFILLNDQGLLIRQYHLFVTPEEPLILEVFGATYNENDVAEPAKAAATAISTAKTVGFEALFQDHCRIWDELWQQADVVIEGDEEAQLALRYSIYHLLSIAPRHSDQVSIPARGLSGQTYKGAVFWDTEMFMLPFYMRTLPKVARNLLLYRVHTLPGALEKAQSYGFQGAFYAWESQEGGFDATSDYNVTDVFTKRPMRTYFKDKQIHISGDIAYAIGEYVKCTGDYSLILAGGAEVIFQCAAFYASYSYYKPNKERYEFVDVIGPDEYHERVYNNAYTNKIASETLKLALNLWSELEDEYSEFLEILLGKTGLEGQRSIWQELVSKLYLQEPDQNGLIEQFDGYFQLEDTTVADVRSRLLDSKEYWGGAYGVAADTQIIKQADVILMLQLFGEEYPLEFLQKNWEYYEPRTEHGSSLSACLYALVACRFGNQEWAYPFFMKTATVDLSGKSKQYAGTIYIGGTHPAANGGAWMTAVLGFAGLKETGEVTATPRLPEKWQSVTFKTHYQGKRYQVKVSQEKVEISNL
ncbi:glycosyl hydrolase family 65 protein, partial [Enterococcus sp. 2201sp1_2201st1_C11_2201SCRN_220225]